MQFDRVNEFGPTSPEAIAEFEARWRVLLPLEYKQFLLNSNGGWPKPDVFEVPGWHGRGSALDAFFGLHEGRKTEQLDRAMNVYDERVPPDLIPIAHDPYGNNICIGWKGQRAGKIYFWDHEDELDENGEFVQDYRNVYLIADSLQEFLDGLTTSEELDKRPRAKRRG